MLLYETTFLKQVVSKFDKTIKFIFSHKGQIIEFSYINKDDGKDIICVPTQTGCKMGCQFCFLTGLDLKVKNLDGRVLSSCIGYIISELNLLEPTPQRDTLQNRVLLISFMGCGEPLLNISGVISVALNTKITYGEKYKVVRFGLASLIPTSRLMKKFIKEVKQAGLLFKFHLSLHSPHNSVRRKIMPRATEVATSVALVEEFMAKTNNSSEIHYTLIEGINDRDHDLSALKLLLTNRGIPVKFLNFSEKPNEELRRSDRVELFRQELERSGIKTEFYIPPGGDIGSSCGQFLIDYYKEFNKKK